MSLLDAVRWLLEPERWAGESGIPARLLEHLYVTGLALLLAAVIALPLGVVIGHARKGSAVVGALTGAFRAIPTLGLLTLFGLVLGIGLTAPMLALVILGIPSLLAGAYSGINALDPRIADASRAIGMNPMQVIWKVELPLASPVLIGGVRAATLQIVATATLAAYTSNTGLGRYLFTGLKSRDYPQMIAGALLVTALAVCLELLLAWLQRLAGRKIADPSNHSQGDQR